MNNCDTGQYADAGKPLTRLFESVANLDSPDKRSAAESARLLSDYLKRTSIAVNLITGNYEAGLRNLSSILDVTQLGSHNIGDLPYISILIALLGRLSLRTHQTRILPRDCNAQLLHELVVRYNNHGDTSASGAISSLPGKGTHTIDRPAATCQESHELLAA